MMNSRIRAFCSLLSIALLAGCVSQREQMAYRHIGGILARPSAGSSEWSVLITDPSGRVRYQKNPTRPSVPASNEKLFTVSGAFGLLGTNHSFETRIYLNGEFANGVLQGDVNLVCEHDITWNPAVFPTNAAAPLHHIAARLKARGLKSVLGRVQCYGACFYNPDGNSRMHDPQSQPEYNRRAAIAFRQALSASGIQVSTNAPSGRAGFFAPGILFYTHQSSDMLFKGQRLNLQTACIPLLKDSENVMADGLLRHVGYRTRGDDSYQAGAMAVGRWLSGTAKVNTNALSMKDGSGLSREDACSAAQLISLLRYMLANYPALARGLPIACTDGTLVHRFCGTAAAGKVHAKTGTLRVCAALSGYVEDSYGAPRYLFSFIANNRGAIDQTRTRQIIDEAVTELAVGY
jgi:D-alanyl-D-alanine carboxypeptidase